MNAITVRDVWVEYGDQIVLERINLEIAPGAFVSIVGPSGCGKSTFLRMVLGQERPTRGTLLLDGAPMPDEPGPDRGVVFQRYSVFPHLTVLGNVTEAPRHVLGLAHEAAAAQARALLARVGLAGREDAWPHALSGGQQQRVAIARALAMEPAVLLLDEPTSALDPRLKGEVLAVIGDLAASGQTMVLVTHELAFARRVAGRVAVLADGRVVEEGAPDEVLERPRHAATRAFLGEG